MEPAVSPSSIAIEARLVHADASRRVVEASAWQQGQCLGRCLAEADNAEIAEDRARARLQAFLCGMAAPDIQKPPRPNTTSGAESAVEPEPQPEPSPRPRPAPPQRLPLATPSPTQDPSLGHANTTPQPSAEEPAADPDDWSDELAELDVQLQRLGWDRNQEGTYLQRAFGHPSRNRLTSFADLVTYLRALRSLASGSPPETAPVPLRRRDLLSQCDQLLSRLGWDPQQGRELLERSFELSSRQQLSDEQLLQFNMLLESELLLKS